MAKERLSRLQKWILRAIYESEHGFIHRQDIYKGFYGVGQGIKRYPSHFGWREYSKEQKKKAESAYVAVSVCLKNMEKKGLVVRGTILKDTSPSLEDYVEVGSHLVERSPTRGSLSKKMVDGHWVFTPDRTVSYEFIEGDEYTRGDYLALTDKGRRIAWYLIIKVPLIPMSLNNKKST